MGKKTHPTPVAYVLAALLGIAFFFVSYARPLAFLAGDSGFFEIGDMPQHVTGWQVFADDVWRWPLLVTERMNAPEGVNIAFTDSIPLAALVFKPFAALLPDSFHYLGLWHLVAKVLQAVGAVFLIRSLGLKDILSAAAAAAMALLWPAQILRLSHTALTTHGLLLVALGVYFRATRNDWPAVRATVVFTLLAIISLLVHPYLLVMVYPLTLAYAGDRWMAGHRLIQSLMIIGVSGLALVAGLLGLGYFGAGGDSPGGFGHFGMNLLSPFCGGALSLCTVQDATGGQTFEGYAYLGAGTFLLLVAALVMAKASGVGATVHRHAFLVAILIGLTIYSVSSDVYLGEMLLFTYPLPPIYQELSEVFRAAGRFFWLVGYALLFGALAVVLRRRLVLALPLVVLAIGLQWADTAPLRAEMKAQTAPDRPFQYDGWLPLNDRIQHVVITPTFGCQGIDSMHYLYFQIVAARLGASINTGYFARNDDLCEPVEIAEFSKHTLYVSQEPVRDEAASDIFEIGVERGTCVRWPSWGGLILCLPGTTQSEWDRIRPDFTYE